ncbi:MAG: DUF4199 domain-containing protein [Bacteroidota bacterium]
MEDIQNEELEQPQTAVQHALKFGGLLGIIGAILTLLLYVIDSVLMVNWVIGIIWIIILLGLVIYGGITYRRELGGYIEFGPAYIHGFVTLVIIGVIGIAVNLLMYEVVDDTLAETHIEATFDQLRGFMEMLGAPEDAIDQAIEEGRADAEEGFTTKGQLIGFAKSLIFYAIVSLIIALIVRRREKVSDVV